MGPDIRVILETLTSLAGMVDLLANLATIAQVIHWLWKEYKHRRDGKRE